MATLRVVLRAFLSCLQCPYVVVRRTDILVGVHGAGLTHGMFMPPGSTMVEILPPGVTHKGFRDMAKLLGHNYFSSHATGRPGQAYTKILPCLAYQSSSPVCALVISRCATSL